MPDYDLDFLSSGKARLDPSVVAGALAEFVDAVVRRLESEMPERTTLLQEEWENLHGLDLEERDFCETAARLGLDPFSLEEEQADEIIQKSGKIPDALREDFFQAAPPGALGKHLEWIERGRAAASGSFSGAVEGFPNLRVVVLGEQRGATPWETGYAYASRLHNYLGLDGEPLFGTVYDETLGFGAAHSVPGDRVNFDAIAARDESSRLGGFALSGRLPVSRRFAYARALFEYLTDNREISLVSRAITSRQRANRAFAAELLAPAEALRKRLPSESISHEHVDELAADFGVSTYVIEHQIQNHHLGRVVP